MGRSPSPGWCFTRRHPFSGGSSPWARRRHVSFSRRHRVRGGCEEYSLTIASAARERGYRVVAALPFRTETQTLIEDFRSRRIEYRPLEIAEDPEAARSSVSRHASRLARPLTLLAHVRPSVVLLALPWPTYGFGTIVACRLLRIPLAVVFQLAALPFAFSRAKLDIYRWARRGPQRWVAVSEHNRAVLRRSFRPEPGGHPSRQECGRQAADEGGRRPFGAANGLGAAVRRELGYDDRDLILLTVGRLHAQKGYLDLISAIPHIVAERPNVRFVWAGEGPPSAGDRGQAASVPVWRSAVGLVGHRSRCASTSRPRRTSSCFRPTSKASRFRCARRSMAGLPVVASDASGMPEIITSGVTGLLFRTAGQGRLVGNAALGAPAPTLRCARWRRGPTCGTFGDHDESRMVEETLAAAGGAPRPPDVPGGRLIVASAELLAGREGSCPRPPVQPSLMPIRPV